MAIKRPLGDTLDPRSTRVTALLYYRFSKLKDDNDIDGRSTAKQSSRCHRLADIEGAEVLGEFSDDGISAAYDVRYEDKPRHRPDFRRLLDEIVRVRPTFVISVYGDRLRRNQEEWIELVKVCARTGTKLRDETTTLDLRESADRLRGTLDTVMFEQYVESVRTKVRSQFAERRRQGLRAGGGRRPYGYEGDRVTVVEDEAKWVRWIADQLLSGEPVRSIARELTNLGVTTPGGGELWRSGTIKQTMRRAINCGWIEHDGELVRPFAAVESGEAEPIMSREQFDLVVAVLDAKVDSTVVPPRSFREDGPGAYFLSGLLRCDRRDDDGIVCGSGLVGSTDKSGRRYKCDRGGHLSTPADVVELAVGELVVKLRSSREHVEGVSKAAEGRSRRWKQVHDRYLDLLTEVDDLADEDTTGKPARQRWVDRRLAKLDDEMTSTRAELDQLDPTNTAKATKLRVQAAKRVETKWATGDPATRRAMVLDVVAGFRVSPSGRGRQVPILDRMSSIPLGGVATSG